MLGHPGQIRSLRGLAPVPRKLLVGKVDGGRDLTQRMLHVGGEPAWAGLGLGVDAEREGLPRRGDAQALVLRALGGLLREEVLPRH